MGCHLGITFRVLGQVKCRQECGEDCLLKRGIGEVVLAPEVNPAEPVGPSGAAPHWPARLSRLHTQPAEIWSSKHQPFAVTFHLLSISIHPTRKLEEKSPKTHFRLKIRVVSLPLNSDLSHILGCRGRQSTTALALRGTENTHFSAEYLR